MNFGERLRQLRANRNLTQPELAEAAGIEQSYLSKLENGKSLPSNEVLSSILDVFKLDVSDLLDELDQGSRNQMRQIPDVAAYLNHQKQRLIGNRKRWLLASSLLLALGVALVYAGNVHLFYTNLVYHYKSDGIVLEGESKEIFRHPSLAFKEAEDNQLNKKIIMDSINARRNEEFVLAGDFRGTAYNVPVTGGSRTFFIDGKTEIDPWQNKAIAFAGILFAMLGAIGLFLERKLSRQ